MKFYQFLLDFKKQGKTVFLSSHDLLSLQEICDKVTILKDKKVVYSANPMLETNNNYVVSFGEIDRALHLFKNSFFKTNMLEKNEITIELIDEQQKLNFFKFVHENKIIINKFERRNINLEDIYRQKVLE
jgi:ABC-type multidrug transport system ATPase subunit